MVYYVLGFIIFLSILFHFFSEFIHLPKNKFKKYLKFFFFIFLTIIVIYLMRFFPAIISSIPAIFLILYRWGNFINFLSRVFLSKKFSSERSMTRSEALEILGLQEGASKEEILKSHQELIKKNHPDLGGSDWITKKINKARDILLG